MQTNRQLPSVGESIGAGLGSGVMAGGVSGMGMVTVSSGGGGGGGGSPHPPGPQGNNIEVKWSVDEQSIWWGCTVLRKTDKMDSYNLPIYEVLYQGRPDLDMPDEEKRFVVFSTPELLVDQEVNEVMQWREEGSNFDPPDPLPVDCAVSVMQATSKASGAIKWKDGQISQVDRFGNYTVKYEDGTTERDVTEDRVQEMQDDSSDGSSDTIIAIDTVAELFVGKIVTDPRFLALKDDQLLEAQNDVEDVRQAIRKRLRACRTKEAERNNNKRSSVPTKTMGEVLRDYVRGMQCFANP